MEDTYMARARALEARTRKTVARELSLGRLQQAKEAPVYGNGIVHASEQAARIMQESNSGSGVHVISTPPTTPVPLVRGPQAPIRPTHERVTLHDSIPRVLVQDEETARRIHVGKNVPRLDVSAPPLEAHGNPGEWFRQRTLYDARAVRERIGQHAGAPDRVKLGIPWGAGPRNPRWGENQ